MSGFTAGWLALREPADAAARSGTITRVAAAALAPYAVVRAVDLATGTGANVRYLTPRLPARQDWLLVDGDPALLAVAERALGHPVRQVDLSDLRGTGLVEGRHLVTASALLDLVSDRWLASLAALCAGAGAVALFALTYDGRIECAPGDPVDEVVRALVNRHQRTDKGFGAALGPAAAARAEQHFRAAGYDVVRDTSDWALGAEERGLQAALIDGWAGAAAEMSPGDAPLIEGWRSRRRALAVAGGLHLVVGHVDLAATPRG